MALHLLLHQDWVIAQLAVPPATGTSDFAAAFPHLAREMEFHRVVAAVSFESRSSPGPACFALVLFAPCRCPIGFAPADFVTAAAGPFGFAVVAAGPVFGLSAADLSVVAVDPGSADSAADFVCFGYFFVAGLGRERTAALASCFLTRRFF